MEYAAAVLPEAKVVAGSRLEVARPLQVDRHTRGRRRRRLDLVDSERMRHDRR
jgi:hypothetical protein